jgi:hypothetical protein
MADALHAWFSIDEALRIGSAVYQKANGSSVNVTRVSTDKDDKQRHNVDEKYLGEVVGEFVGTEDGDGMKPTHLVRSITG